MKKGIIVLLIMALVAGTAFAGKLTGSAQIDFGYNLNNQEWGFANGQATKYSFSFEYDTTAVAKDAHETDVWAEIAAEASAYFELDKDENAAGTVDGIWEVEITKANIHVGEVTFGILNCGKGADYAKAYYKVGTAIYNGLTADAAGVDGFTVEYDGYKGGFGAEGDVDAKTYTVYAHAATKEYTVAEGATVKAAAWTKLSDSAKAVGGAVMATYKADKLSADAAADVKYAADKVTFEADANATYDFVTANVYAVSKDYDADGDYEVKLDAKVSAKYDVKASDEITVALEGSVDGRDLLDASREITVAAKESTTIDAIAIEANETYKIYAKELGADVKCTYTADMFVTYAKVAATFDFDLSDACKAVTLEAGISSKKVVENAELSLTYKGLDFIDLDHKKGTVTASAKIEF